MRYYAKPNTWFDAGTEAWLNSERVRGFTDPAKTIPCESGLFLGTKDGKLDEEWCRVDEFEVVG